MREIQVSCELSQIPTNAYFPCEAIGVYSNGTGRNITFEAEWATLDSTILETAREGSHSWMRGLAPGSSEVTASADGITGSFPVTVTNATPISISVTPANQTFTVGAQQQFTGICIFSDNSYADITRSADWRTFDVGVGEITTGTLMPGLLTARATGSTIIEAAFSGLLGTTQITVTDKTLLAIQISPDGATTIKGLTTAYTATGVFTDLSTMDLTSSVAWSVVDGSIGTISNATGSAGRFTGLNAGTTRIRAVAGAFSDEADVTVSNPTLTSISLSPATPSIPDGTSQRLTATGNFSDGNSLDISEEAVWVSGDITVASVTNVAGQKGQVTGNSQGTVIISASLAGIIGQTTVTIGAPSLTSILVTTADNSVPQGLTSQYFALGIYSDGSSTDLTSSVTWASDDTSVAAVSNVGGTKGVVTAVGIGGATITATLGALQGQAAVTITSSILVSISLTPANPVIANGLNEQLVATGHFSDGSTLDISESATWSSGAFAVATVSNTFGSRGLVTGVSQGGVLISAALDGVIGQVVVTISAPLLTSIAVTTSDNSIPKGLTSQYTAVGTYSDGSSANLTSSVSWASVNTSVADVNLGLVTGVGIGTTGITATLGTISGQTDITVTAAELVSISVTPINPTLTILVPLQFTAVGNYTDGSTANLTDTVTWASTNTLTATISNAAGTKGRATGAGLGTTTISATAAGGISGSTQLTGLL